MLRKIGTKNASASCRTTIAAAKRRMRTAVPRALTGTTGRLFNSCTMVAPMSFGGVFSVLPTPFGPSGDFDPDSLGRVIDLFLTDGVNGFTALGVTSEVARLTEAERDQVLDAVLAHVAGRVPVVAGTTAEGLRTCIEYTRRAKAA